MKVETFYSPNDVLNNRMQEIFMNGKGDFVNYRKGKELDRVLVFDSEKKERFKWEKYPIQTRVVHDAICTLYLAGQREISITAIWRVATGADSSAEPTAQGRKKIHDAIDYFMATRLHIEIRADEKPLFDSKENLISCATLTLAPLGKIEYDCVSVLKAPPLLAYAQFRNRVLSFPAYLLRFGGYSTALGIALKHFLLREIEIMKNAKNYRNNTIKLDRIFEELQLKEQKQKERVRESIKKLLSDLVDESYIRGFRFRQEGKKFIAIEIELNNNNETERQLSN